MFVEIDHEIISTVILLPAAESFIQEELLSFTRENMCTKYWLTACSSWPRKRVVRRTDRPAMTIAVDFGPKATKQRKCILFLYPRFLASCDYEIHRTFAAHVLYCNPPQF